MLEILAVEEPCRVDVLGLLGMSLDSRENFLLWLPCSSEIDACFGLRDATPARSHVRLRSTSCPVLCLLDALDAAGWTAFEGPASHAEESPMLYDSSKLSKKLSYP